MTIREQVKDLWRLCFNDTEEFIEMYFRHRYTPGTNIAIQSGENVISALQMIPYPMTFLGGEISTSYISGACTHPDFQGKGVMKELLSQSFARMVKEDVPLSTLIPAEPWLFDYYKKMGYATVFNYAHYVVAMAETDLPSSVKMETGTAYNEEVYGYLNKKMRERTCCIQHTSADYEVILEDLALGGGTVISASEEGNITGIAIAVPGDETVRVNEIFAENKETESYMLYKACQLYNASKADIITPTTNFTKIHPLGMARIINARQILKLYAAASPDTEINIELYDAQISANNGFFYIVDGKCMTSEKKLPGSHLKLNISELTKMILEPQHPYMSLMLN